MKIHEFDLKMLNKAGIQSGDTLYFEFTGIENESENLEVVHQLQTLVGEDGLLVIPTCTSREGVPKPAFNPGISPSEMGALSETFRHQTGVHRSNHPTHSLAAWGKDAGIFTGKHKYAHGRQTPWGESALGLGSPWERLWEQNAWCVLIDPDWTQCPLLDYAAARFVEQNKGITKETVFPVFSPAWLEEHFSQVANAWEGEIANLRVRVFPMRQMAAGILEALEEEPDRCVVDPNFLGWLDSRKWVDQNGYLLAGVSKTVITPEIPFPRWEGKPMTEVFRDLYARVLFLQSAEHRFALVLCDLIGTTADITCAIRQRVADALPDNPPAVMVACTHAHSTPDTIGAGFASAEMLAGLVDKIADGILRASQRMQPVRMGWIKTEIRGVAHSRRWKLQNGRVFTTRYGVPSTWRVHPELIVSQGAIDPELTVLRLETLAGDVFAVLSNFGVHPSVAMASSSASGDITGEAMHILETALGVQVVAFCTTGAAGDVDPTREMPYWGPRKEQNVVHVGRLLAAQVLEAVERTTVQDKHAIRTFSMVGRVKMRQDWLHLMQSEKEMMKSEFPEAGETSRWIEQMVKNGWSDLEIQAVLLGDLFLVAVPGEVFARTALQLKQDLNIPLVVLETTNDYIGYIPPQQEFDEGGYECDQHFASRVSPEAEETVRRLAMEAISGLKMGQNSVLLDGSGFCELLTHRSEN